jgi:hypothetical protein
MDVARAGIERLAEARIGEDTPADTIARFEQNEALAEALAFARCGEAGGTGTDNQHIRIARRLRADDVRCRDHRARPGEQRTAGEG